MLRKIYAAIWGSKNKEAIHIYENILENVYNNGCPGLIPNNNITLSVLISLVKFVSYTIASDFISINELKNIKYHIKILISLCLTLKEIADNNPQMKSLISDISDCISTRDVIHWEVAILFNKKITENIMDQLITLIIKRNVKTYKEINGASSKLKLADGYSLQNAIVTFFVIPLLNRPIQKHDAFLISTDNLLDEEVDVYYNNLKQCYEVIMPNIVLSINDDTDWKLTSELYKQMYNIMIDICEFHINHKDTTYFIDKLKKEYGMIDKINGIDVNICWPSFLQKNPDVKFLGKYIDPQVDIINDDKILITHNKYSGYNSFVIYPSDGQLLGIKWDPICGNNNLNYNQLEFDAEKQKPTKSQKYGNDRYFPLLNQLITKHNTINIPHNCKELLLHKTNDTIELYVDSGKIIFKSSSIAIYITNCNMEINKMELD